MCLARISTTTLALVGATSTGGLVVLLSSLFSGRKGPKRARREPEDESPAAAMACRA